MHCASTSNTVACTHLLLICFVWVLNDGSVLHHAPVGISQKWVRFEHSHGTLLCLLDPADSLCHGQFLSIGDLTHPKELEQVLCGGRINDESKHHDACSVEEELGEGAGRGRGGGGGQGEGGRGGVNAGEEGKGMTKYVAIGDSCLAMSRFTVCI